MIYAPAFNHKLKKLCIYRGFLKSQTQEILNLSGVSEIVLRNLTKGRKNLEQDNEKATTWNIAAQKLPNRRKNSKWPPTGETTGDPITP